MNLDLPYYPTITMKRFECVGSGKTAAVTAVFTDGCFFDEGLVTFPRFRTVWSLAMTGDRTIVESM